VARPEVNFFRAKTGGEQGGGAPWERPVYSSVFSKAQSSGGATWEADVLPQRRIGITRRCYFAPHGAQRVLRAGYYKQGRSQGRLRARLCPARCEPSKLASLRFWTGRKWLCAAGKCLWIWRNCAGAQRKRRRLRRNRFGLAGKRGGLLGRFPGFRRKSHRTRGKPGCESPRLRVDSVAGRRAAVLWRNCETEIDTRESP
jgi:hypothetical protein